MLESKKMENKKRIENGKGITLIALVITIIVLLILAGVSIAMLTGQNGILTQATNAKERTDKATEEEKIQMAVLGSSIVDNGYAEVLDTDSFKQELANQFGSQELDVIANGDGSFIITVEDTQRKYYVNDDKTVINSDNIIEISTAEELATFRDEVNNGNSYEGKAVLLTDDNITLSGEWEPIGYYDQATDEKNPDTTTNKPFKGIFDGGNCTINGINITTNKSYQGLFSFVVDGTIRNVIIGENNNISGNTRVGGVVGYLYGFSGNISNCINYANGNFSGIGGGIVGFIAGQHTIYNCKNYGSITGTAGIVGGSNGTDWGQFTNVYNTIINCGNYGEVIGARIDGSTGGIVANFKGDIFNCCNKSKVSNTINNRSPAAVGGIVGGLNDGKIVNCYNINDITSNLGYAGGIAGNQERICSIENCYSLGNIIGNSNVGEITGNENIINKMENCYTSTDTFTAEDLGDAFVDNPDPEKANQPLLYWEVNENESESY